MYFHVSAQLQQDILKRCQEEKDDPKYGIFVLLAIAGWLADYIGMPRDHCCEALMSTKCVSEHHEKPSPDGSLN